MNGEVITQALALLIPIAAVVMGIGLAMLGLIFDYRRRRDMFELHHKERMALIEKGVDVPPLPADFFQTRKVRLSPNDLLRRGLLFLFVGAALIVALAAEEHGHPWWGSLLVAIGLAYLIAYFVDRRPSNVGA